MQRALLCVSVAVPHRGDRHPAARPQVRSGFCRHHVLNGNGDMTGTPGVQESGFLETPILITNTGGVGVVRDAALGWMNGNKYFAPMVAHVWFAYPLVAETYDGVLNDMDGFHVKPEHVNAALDSAKSGPVPEGRSVVAPA